MGRASRRGKRALSAGSAAADRRRRRRSPSVENIGAQHRGAGRRASRPAAAPAPSRGRAERELLHLHRRAGGTAHGEPAGVAGRQQRLRGGGLELHGDRDTVEQHRRVEALVRCSGAPAAARRVRRRARSRHGRFGARPPPPSAASGAASPLGRQAADARAEHGGRRPIRTGSETSATPGPAAVSGSVARDVDGKSFRWPDHARSLLISIRRYRTLGRACYSFPTIKRRLTRAAIAAISLATSIGVPIEPLRRPWRASARPAWRAPA